jgi:hypothetical protein
VTRRTTAWKAGGFGPLLLWLLAGRSLGAAPGPAAPDPTALDDVMRGLDQTGTPPGPPRTDALPAPSAPPGTRRPAPDYQGRERDAPDLAETLIWVPRVAFYPLHAVAEYGLRRPIVGGITAAEKHYVFARVERVFTWWNGRAGFFPIFRVDLGLKPAVGFTAFAHGLGHPDNDVAASASVWSERLLQVRAEDSARVFRGGNGTWSVRASYLRRPDGIFYGIGGDTRTDDRAFFFFRRMEVGTGLEGRLSGLNRVGLDVALRRVRFEGSGTAGTRDIVTRFGGPDQPPLPPGFPGGYALVMPRVRLVVDSRRPADEDYRGSGLRFEADGGYGLDPGDTGTSFLSYGADAAALWDFTGYNHVLGGRVNVRFVDKLGRNPVPFTELASLGGLELLRGFLAGRLLGPSALEATLQYRYPIWSFLDSEIFSSVGNVFEGHLSGFAPRRLFLAWGLSLRTSLSRESSFGLTLAFGSNRFDSTDFRPADSIRFFIGLNEGF